MSEGARRRLGEATSGRIGQQVTQSVDNAVAFFRRLTEVVPGRKASAKPGSRDRGAARRGAASPSRESLQRLEAAHRRLAEEVSAQELELERMRLAITSRTAVGAKTDGSVDRLGEFMEAARGLREKIQEKRLELARLERRLARERQLLGIWGSEGGSTESPATAPARGAGESPRAGARRPVITDSTLQGALRRASVQDRTELVLVEGIAQSLLSANAEVRRQAMARLGARPKPAVPLLLLGADDPDERVRLAALGGLTGQAGASVVEVFRRFLRDESAALRLAALRGLVSIDPGLLTSADLVVTLEDRDPGIRRAAAAVLGWQPEGAGAAARVMNSLRFAMYDEDDDVRAAAAEALGATGDDRAVLALVRAIADRSEAVRAAAAESLRAIVGPEVDAVASDAPAAERAEALKKWWRAERVRLRTRSGTDERAEVGNAARDVLERLASLRLGSPAAPPPVAPAPRAAPAAPAAQPPPAAAKVEVAPAPPAPRAAPKEETPKPPATAAVAPAAKKVEVPPVPEAIPAVAEAAAPEAKEEETSDFESMFQQAQEGEEGEGEEAEEGKEGESKEEGEGGDEYESILGGDG